MVSQVTSCEFHMLQTHQNEIAKLVKRTFGVDNTYDPISTLPIRDKHLPSWSTFLRSWRWCWDPPQSSLASMLVEELLQQGWAWGFGWNVMEVSPLNPLPATCDRRMWGVIFWVSWLITPPPCKGVEVDIIIVHSSHSNLLSMTSPLEKRHGGGPYLYVDSAYCLLPFSLGLLCGHSSAVSTLLHSFPEYKPHKPSNTDWRFPNLSFSLAL